MGYMDNWSPYDELYGDTDTERYDTSYLDEEEYPTADRDYEEVSADVD